MSEQNKSRHIGVFASTDNPGFLGIGFVTDNPLLGTSRVLESFFEAPEEEFLDVLESTRVILNRHNKRN